LAAGLGEPDDDGERVCRKSDVARGDILSILGGPCPHVIPYIDPMFLDDVLECFRIVSLGIS